MVTADDVKRWVRQGLVGPKDGCACYNPEWGEHGQTRTLWAGEIDGYPVQLYPDGRRIDMTTFWVGRRRKS